MITGLILKAKTRSLTMRNPPGPQALEGFNYWAQKEGEDSRKNMSSKGRMGAFGKRMQTQNSFNELTKNFTHDFSLKSWMTWSTLTVICLPLWLVSHSDTSFTTSLIYWRQAGGPYRRIILTLFFTTCSSSVALAHVSVSSVFEF